MTYPHGGAANIFGVGGDGKNPKKDQISNWGSFVEGTLDAAGVSTAVYKERDKEPLHNDFKYEVDGTWYSPDFIVMAGLGQSNEIGNAAATNGKKTGDGDVFAWNGSAWVEAALESAPFNTASGKVNNKLFHAAHKVSVDQGRPVLLFLTAVAGTGINDWDPSVANNDWADSVTEIEAGLAHADLWGDEKVDLLSFGWGEDAFDAGPALWTYGETRLPDIIDAVKDASWSSESVFFAATLPVQEKDGGEAWQISREWVHIAAVGEYSNFAVVPSAGLTLTGADAGLQVHFNGASLQELGIRLADIYLGKATGITSDAAYSRGIPEMETFDGHRMVLCGDLVYGPTDVLSDKVQIISGSTGFPVLFVAEDNGVVTRTGEYTAGVAKKSELIVSSANNVKVQVYVGAAAGYDNPVQMNLSAGDGAGENSLRRMYFPRSAPLKQVYITGASNLVWNAEPANWPRTIEVFRIQSSPLVTFNNFVAQDLPLDLTTLNFNRCIAPSDVIDAINVERTYRGNTFSFNAPESSGFSSVSSFVSVTELSDAISEGFSKPDGWVAIISNPTAGTIDFLQAKDGAAAVSGVAPANWQSVS